MSPPHFPIRPEGLEGSWRFATLEEGEHVIEGFEVTAVELPHKGGRTFGYRIVDPGGASVVYASDHGPQAMGPGDDGHGPLHEAILDLARGADVLVHDAQFTASELTWPRTTATPPSTTATAWPSGRRWPPRAVPPRPGLVDDDVERIGDLAPAVLDVTIAHEGETITL